MAMTSDETKRFVKMVAEFPALYKRIDINYRDQPLKDSIWGGIGEKFNTSGEICKKRWRNLKISYTRRYKGKGDIDKSANSQIYQLMSFLEEDEKQGDDIVEAKTRSYRRYKHPKTKVDPSKDPLVIGIEHVVFNKPLDLFKPVPKPSTSKGKIPDSLQTTKEPESIPPNHQSILSTPHTGNMKSNVNSVWIKIEPDSILPDTNSLNDPINTAKEIEHTENSIPAILKRRHRLQEEQNGSPNDTATRVTSTDTVTDYNITSDVSNTNSVAPSINEEASEEDRNRACFVQHVKEVLDKLPNILQIQAKQEMFRILTKYELMALEINNGNISIAPKSPNKSPSPPPAKIIKTESESLDLDVENIKVEPNYFDDALDITEELS